MAHSLRIVIVRTALTESILAQAKETFSLHALFTADIPPTVSSDTCTFQDGMMGWVCIVHVDSSKFCF